MNQENKYENISNLSLDSFSFLENLFEFSPHEKNNIEYKDNNNKEEQKEYIFKTINNNINIHTQALNQKASNEEVHKYKEEKNNVISGNIHFNIPNPISQTYIYRKDAHYKHFKVILGKYIKNKLNELKNKCFPYYSKNNFSTPNYKYTGNPKEKDNFYFLFFTIKDILIYGKDIVNHNRQYNNELILKFIELNENKALDKDVYTELITFLNARLEKIIIQFYDDDVEFNKLKNDFKCFQLDFFYKRETGISLLEKYGFIKALKKYNTQNKI